MYYRDQRGSVYDETESCYPMAPPAPRDSACFGLWLRMASRIVKTLRALRLSMISQTRQKHTASVVFLHGSGDSGDGVSEWIEDLLGDRFVFPHIRVVFPTAPPRPYTPMDGMITTVWFDRKQISIEVPDDEQGIQDSATLLNKLIDAEVQAGIPKRRIIIGGFSMGGSMAMHLAYRHHPDLAGVFAMSSFLSEDSTVYKDIAKNQVNPPLFQAHGHRDPLVPYIWGQKTNDELCRLGIENEFHSFPRLYHQMSPKELMLLKSWILRKLPLD